LSAPTSELLTLSALLAAFAAALAGSLHCAGMCGPLRLLCSNVSGASWKYQAGRGLAYGLLGALAGGVGFVLPLWALLPLLLLGFLGSSLNLPSVPAWTKVRRYLLRVGSNSPFLLGLSSGLLPCGLLHGWAAAAAATAHPIHGALLLGMLWAGSLPALELGPTLLRAPLEKLRRKFPKALKAALIGIALLPLAMRLPERMGKPPVLPVHHCHAPNEP
jgi:uncharacterized protein